MLKKKKTEQKLEMGYCPFESRYNGLYRDTGLGRCGLGTAYGPRHSQDSAMIQPSLRHDMANMACDMVGPRARASGARARAWLLGDWVAIQMGVS